MASGSVIAAIDNLQWFHVAFNRMKGTMSQDRFIQLAQLIAGVGGGLSGSLQPSISCPSLTNYRAVWFFFHFVEKGKGRCVRIASDRGQPADR